MADPLANGMLLSIIKNRSTGQICLADNGLPYGKLSVPKFKMPKWNIGSNFVIFKQKNYFLKDRKNLSPTYTRYDKKTPLPYV